eukprot:945325-Rhodomonas_salina.1
MSSDSVRHVPSPVTTTGQVPFGLMSSRNHAGLASKSISVVWTSTALSHPLIAAVDSTLPRVPVLSFFCTTLRGVREFWVRATAARGGVAQALKKIPAEGGVHRKVDALRPQREVCLVREGAVAELASWGCLRI